MISMVGQRSIVIDLPNWMDIDEISAKRLAKRILKRLVRFDLSSRLRLTPEEAAELEKKVKEGALRRLP